MVRLILITLLIMFAAEVGAGELTVQAQRLLNELNYNTKVVGELYSRKTK